MAGFSLLGKISRDEGRGRGVDPTSGLGGGGGRVARVLNLDNEEVSKWKMKSFFS